MQKTHSNAVVKTLPEERQWEIYERIKKDGYPKTLRWLGDDGLKTSLAALYAFFKWFERTAVLSADLELYQDKLKAENPGWTNQQIRDAGIAKFQQQAIARDDAETFINVGYLDLGERSAASKADLENRKLHLREKEYQRKFVKDFLKWAEDAKARDIISGADSNDEKTEKLGELLFGANWK